ncbi:P-loop NTPase fold protein [Mesorhizobium sp.]|uniref:P-loop NTPase fold protein n=1 Tax=Mesorhizobium sp. TaxID=1871066 RepID=UPI0025EEF584|nr:P-loop NTPase fold protein [Mesorhizobium sp.]
MNEHAAEALDAYLDAEHLAVPHAVLVEGPWGSGKTHFLKKQYVPRRNERLHEERRTQTPFVFVSLFGAKSAQDVEQRMFRAASPIEAAVGGLVGTLFLAVGGLFRMADAAKEGRDKVAKKAIERLNDCIFVFDDLERAEREAMGEIMGLVNALVEERERRVILVADETQLKERFISADWQLRNEKIVGRRIRIEPAVGDVTKSFVSDLVDGRTKTFMQGNLDGVLDVVRRSGATNLRNIGWGLYNSRRFADCLLTDSTIPEQHVVRTMLVVLATTLGLRENKIDERDFEHLPGLSHELAMESFRQRNGKAQENHNERANAVAFSRQFRDLDVESPPIDYSFIHELERSGVLDGSAVIAWLKKQFAFGEERSEPSWRRLWHSYKAPRAATEKAIEDLASELSRHEHTEHGIILHVTGLALTLEQAGDRRLTREETVVAFFERYIDDLVADARLPPSPIEAFRRPEESYGQLGFSSMDRAEFKAISAYLQARGLERAESDRKLRAEHVLAQAEAGNLDALQRFYLQDESDLSKRPVLHYFDIERVATLMTRDFPELEAGRTLLAYRYHDIYANHPLTVELDWARSVVAAVDRILDGWVDPHRFMAKKALRGLLTYYEKDRDPTLRLLANPSTNDEAAGLLDAGEPA